MDFPVAGAKWKRGLIQEDEYSLYWLSDSALQDRLTLSLSLSISVMKICSSVLWQQSSPRDKLQFYLLCFLSFCFGSTSVGCHLLEFFTHAWMCSYILQAIPRRSLNKSTFVCEVTPVVEETRPMQPTQRLRAGGWIRGPSLPPAANPRPHNNHHPPLCRLLLAICPLARGIT